MVFYGEMFIYDDVDRVWRNCYFNSSDSTFYLSGDVGECHVSDTRLVIF